MKKLNLNDVRKYVETNIGVFHQKRIQSLDDLKLSKVLRRKNPYLFKAKHVTTSEQIVKSLADAHISSHEETIFGDWLEGLAIYICSKVYKGRKSGIKGIDLEFERGNTKYIITIKSGPNWGNSGQIGNMVANFKTAKKILRTSNSKIHVEAINGCCYGKDNKPDKGEYFKYCGQAFWEFISGEKDLYLKIIEPLGTKAKERNEEFLKSYSKMINLFTKEFSNEYCKEDGEIDWEKIVKLNSGK